ncbi:HDIG domain-containing protein [Hathewaya proteolytica DSM 3090]|uniref:HDIG domain-containing protein n=1 Tax=Hathewaya proteolytica DSM 3090 TaxID=1121331 RepID=A0A1M6M1H2_9CLOT|nr:HD domain-containing protein [Hathewaya proteolytica]SHJ77193.1 HDIG domain-containing protein [Hathewaya proteolytica DSM 3090]
MKNYCEYGVPTREEAMVFLKEAEKLNPGPWVEHSLYVAEAAKLIAERVEGLDSEVAYILGLLHDIGRRYGVTNERHSFDGYKFAMENGYDLWARICMTHGYLCKNVDDVCGKKDCTEEERNIMKEYLDNIEFSTYDKLIQMCDSLALPSGFCILEKRMIDVVMRYGFNEFTLEKWKITFEIQSFFEEKIGVLIYDILPNVR